MKISRPLFVCLTLISGTAFANPIMMVMRLSATVTGNTHVRLRYLTNGSGPPSLTTYGTSRSDWFTNGDTTSEDTGSGVQTMTYQYMCDCHVPTSSALTYQGDTGSMPSYYASQMTVTVTPAPSTSTLCDEKCALADSRDAGVETGGATATGGITTTGGTTATGGTMAIETAGTGGSSGTGGVAGDGTTSVTRTVGGSCSLVPGSRGVLSTLLVFGLVALAVRRRR